MTHVPYRLIVLAVLAGSAAAQARSPERVTFPVSITWDVGPGNNVYLVGSHPDVGSWNPVNAHKLRWTSGNNWTGQVAVQAGTALEYKFIYRNGASNQYCNGANVVWEGGANRTTNLPAAARRALHRQNHLSIIPAGPARPWSPPPATPIPSPGWGRAAPAANTCTGWTACPRRASPWSLPSTAAWAG
jgi:hypothetical protein